jgi:Carbohydrate-selective porin, OprB family/S-layer homology domain
MAKPAPTGLANQQKNYRRQNIVGISSAIAMLVVGSTSSVLAITPAIKATVELPVKSLASLGGSAVESTDEPVDESIDGQPVELAGEPILGVSQLSDVQPTDWSFQALQSLINRYGVVAGYPDSTFRGTRSLSRYEFAAALNAALEQLHQQLQAGLEEGVSDDDWVTLQRLQTEFAGELATLGDRLDALTGQVATLEAQQFSTTTTLTGQTIFAVNAGGFGGDTILAPTGAVIADEEPNPTLIYRTSLDLNTSFTGTDLLKLRLVTGSDGITDNVAGFLEPNFGSVLDFSVPGRNDQVGVGRLYYTFRPLEDVSVTVGAAMVATEYVDKNSYANVSFRDFSTQALVNNFVLFPRPAGAGAAVDWNPNQGDFSLRAVYIAASAARTGQEAQRSIGGPIAPALLFPNQGAQGGLFGDPRLGIVELEYAPSRAFAVRLQYANGEIFESNFDAIGVNVEATLFRHLGIFGRYGYSTYDNTFQGTLHPQYWMAGVAFPDLFVRGSRSGIAVGQPFIETNIGNATQTNFEAFYNLPIHSNITITPLVQVILNSGNQDENGTIVTGTLRTVFSF